MKKVVVVLAALTISLATFAGNGPTLGKEIRKKAIISLNKVDIKKDRPEMVVVKFMIHNGEIEILIIKGTNEILEQRVKERLEKISVDSDYEENKKYTMRFSFEAE